VLIAGKGHEDYQDIQGKKHPFDDRKIARYLMQDLKTARAQEREEKAAEREAMRGGFDRPDRQ
jgi:UDP-N-acetylmuramoyl-L-alanyl-D-glutamate--2,6-diaminopimelate ligase